MVTLQPVVDRLRGDRCGQRTHVLRWRAGDGGELLEAPVRQCGWVPRRLTDGEAVAASRFGPEVAGLDVALHRAVASVASRLVERFNARVSLIGWALGPFPMGGVRSDSRHTESLHGECSFLRAPEGAVVRKLHTGRCGGVARAG